MSILKNLLGNFMPHFESRRSSRTLSALNAELVLDLDGDNSATIQIYNSAAFTGTYIVEGTVDGVNWIPVLAFLYTGLLGTLPLPGQPIVSEASTLAISRTLCVATGGLRGVKVRLSAYTSGAPNITINADTCDSLSPYVRDQKAATLIVTATGAAAAAVTATLPAVAGLRHYIDFVEVVRSATAALTAAAAPVVVTTTNIPGLPSMTFGADAGGIGIDKTNKLDFGASGISALLANTNTTVVAPAYTGVIWRINVAYRLGL